MTEIELNYDQGKNDFEIIKNLVTKNVFAWREFFLYTPQLEKVLEKLLVYMWDCSKIELDDALYIISKNIKDLQIIARQISEKVDIYKATRIDNGKSIFFLRFIKMDFVQCKENRWF